MQPGTPRRDQYAPLPPDVAARWQAFGRWDRPYYPNLLGMVVEEIRTDYCRMRLPFQPILEQPAGVVHGGAIASLIDAVVVPAIGTAYGPDTTFVTVDLQMQYLGALRGEDAVAEGWIVQRGRSMVFCEAEVLGVSSGRRMARGLLTYMVRSTGGTVRSTDGTVRSTDGTVRSTDGTVRSTGGTVRGTDG